MDKIIFSNVNSSINKFISTLVALLALPFFSFSQLKTNFIEINNKKTHYTDAGSGDPIIVFVSGLGVTMDDFNEIAAKISKTNRTILYDRAGIGQSEAMNSDRNLENISSELNILLSAIGIHKSIILVGHSRGGLIVRYFASKYPNKVSGLVLIDPAIPELLQRKRELRTESEKTQFDNCYKSFYSDSVPYSATIKSEFKEFYTTDLTLLSDKTLPVNIPLTIIASNKVTDEKYKQQDVAIKEELLKSYVKSAPQLKLVLTDKSGHFIYSDEPELVIKEIITLTNKIKNN